MVFYRYCLYWDCLKFKGDYLLVKWFDKEIWWICFYFIEKNISVCICIYINLLVIVFDKFINSKLWILEIISWIYVSIIFLMFKNIILVNFCVKGE